MPCAYAHAEMQVCLRCQEPHGPEAVDRLRYPAASLPERDHGCRLQGATELYEETAAKNPKFKKIYDAWKKFMADENLWFRIAEGTYANYMYNAK
jgi:TRAP-type mannitol/chloroaromatic compound transport system substrate-binding protein